MKIHIYHKSPGNYWVVAVQDTWIEFIVESQQQAFSLAIEIAKGFGLPY
jgi:hypothetical protein